MEIKNKINIHNLCTIVILFIPILVNAGSITDWFKNFFSTRPKPQITTFQDVKAQFLEPKLIGRFIPYELNSSFQNGLRVKAKVNDSKPVSFLVDTGSTGVVVSKDKAGNFDTFGTTGTPGKITYSSSGRVLNGYWINSKVEFTDGGGENIAVSHVPVLVVMYVSCLPKTRANYNTCRPEPEPKGIAMLGVGFGREYDGMEQSTPDKNPFLNTEEMVNKEIGRGFEIKKEGIVLGIDKNSLNGLTQIKLEPMANISGEWLSPKMNMVTKIPQWDPKKIYKKGEFPQYDFATTTASVLLDTGINGNLLGIRTGKPGFVVPFGTEIELNPLGTDLKWKFLTQKNARYVKTENFINTSIYPMAMINYVYDADNGILGISLK
jgi:hypothetical protein